MAFENPNLLKRLRSGDREAYAEVAERYHKEIWAYAYRLCGDRETASDICQETAISVWHAAPEFLGVKALRAWIYRVAHNAYVDRCRKSRLQVVPLDAADGMSASGADQQTLTALVTRDSLERALAKLPENLREAVVLTKVQGLTCGEAAEVLGVPSGTLKWWVSQGLKMLREQMKEEPE